MHIREGALFHLRIMGTSGFTHWTRRWGQIIVETRTPCHACAHTQALGMEDLSPPAVVGIGVVLRHEPIDGTVVESVIDDGPTADWSHPRFDDPILKIQVYACALRWQTDRTKNRTDGKKHAPNQSFDEICNKCLQAPGPQQCN